MNELINKSNFFSEDCVTSSNAVTCIIKVTAYHKRYSLKRFKTEQTQGRRKTINTKDSEGRSCAEEVLNLKSFMRERKTNQRLLSKICRLKNTLNSIDLKSLFNMIE